MPHTLQRKMSKLFHPRASSVGNGNKGEGGGVGKKSNQVSQSESTRMPSLPQTPTTPRPKPIFSLSSLSFRRPSTASSQSTVTPPASRPPTPPKSDDTNDDSILNIRVPPPSPHESSSHPSTTSYFDFSPSSFSSVDNRVTLSAFHSHSVPPSPLSASYLSPRSKPHLQDSSYSFPSPSAASQRSRFGESEEPVSRFSDWGTSIEGSISRNPSSEDLSHDEEGGGRGSVTDLTSPESKVITTHHGHITISETLSRSSSPSPSPPSPPIRHRSAPATTDLQHRPHLLHHHHHSTHSHLPRESRVADSSYPELAIAFFSSVKKFKERKLERRASTGSLGGAV